MHNVNKESAQLHSLCKFYRRNINFFLNHFIIFTKIEKNFRWLIIFNILCRKKLHVTSGQGGGGKLKTSPNITKRGVGVQKLLKNIVINGRPQIGIIVKCHEIHLKKFHLKTSTYMVYSLEYLIKLQNIYSSSYTSVPEDKSI